MTLKSFIVTLSVRHRASSEAGFGPIHYKVKPMSRILSVLLVGTLVSPAAAQQPPTVVRSRTAVTTDSTTVQGHALSAANAPLRSVHVRLRDVRLGRIVDEAMTDDDGFFRFAGVDPGSYIIELIGNDKTVLAASQLITPNAGDQ